MSDVLHSADVTLVRILRCWGKTGKDVQSFHPALYHMLDVGHVAQVLLREPASVRWRHILAEALGMDEGALADWLPWVVALHDIGKLSVSFQGQVAEQKTRLIGEGFDMGTRRDNLPHALISRVFAEDAFTGIPAEIKPCVAEAIGGHHGSYNKPDDVRDTRDLIAYYESAEWRDLRRGAADYLRTHLLLTQPMCELVARNVSAAAAALTGFMIVCDWIGSDSRFFGTRGDADPSEYPAYSLRQALRAVEAAGLLQVVLSGSPTAIAELFDDLGQLRPLQQAIDNIPSDILASPCLAIIEAPTGEGKTEAALALAHRIGLARHTDEMYYALPTMATSNQMFSRLQTHLRDRLHLPTRIKLVHGQAFLIEDDLQIEPLPDADTTAQDSSIEWFSSKKRALLAPFGVGTIDQIELAALNARHTVLRLAGLAGKVVIIDEVHAYDVYMTTIVERLLKWLKALGSSVILLSATLPVSRRNRLAQAFGLSITEHAGKAYPSLIAGSAEDNGKMRLYAATPEAWQPLRQITVGGLHFGDEDADAKAQWLLDQIRDGGCACWITNTVDRAQKLFESVTRIASSHAELSLLHAQFPLDERLAREEALTGKYGRNGKRPERGIVIGTQVLEQSLDLDFDVMASDLAPIDLLLQRAGRMHRHDRLRPQAHAIARLWVNTVLRSATDTATLTPDSLIYDEYILRLTWQVLSQHQLLTLPADYRPLVEAVYDETGVAKGHALWDVWRKLQMKQEKAGGEARIRLLPEPDPEELFCASAAKMTFEEDENRAAWVVAQTRLGEESVNVIPLELLDEATCKGPDGLILPLNKPLPRNIQMRLLRRGLRISRRDAVQAIKAGNAPLPQLFKGSALLKGHLPLWLKGGQVTLQAEKRSLTLRLDQRLGLVIEKENR